MKTDQDIVDNLDSEGAMNFEKHQYIWNSN